jgi:hypothetical protein
MLLKLQTLYRLAEMRLVDDLEWRVGKDLEGKVVAYFKVRS